MMKIKNTLCLHILMATLAILFLCVHPLVTSFDPPLAFQPLIKSMAGTPKEQAEKIATISHALEGNAIFFIGASEVATSEDEHYAVYNYFNKQLHKPVVAYGDAFVDDETQFLLFSRFKNSLNANSKVVMLLAPDSFYSKGLPPAIYADNFPGSIFNPLMKDPQARPLLVNYLKHIDSKDISHLTFGQMRVFGWHPDLMWDELSFQFANVCTLIKNDWLALLNFEVLHYGRYQVLPWSRHGGKLLSTHLPALGCLQLIVARKRTIPLTLNPMKSGKAKTQLRPAVGATRQWRKGQN